MKYFFLTLLLASQPFTGTAITDENDIYTLYLVRHAEKQLDDSDDPRLTDAGKKRSEQLAKWLRDKDIQDVWSSDFRRTRDTAKPALKQNGLATKLYDPQDQPALVKQLLESQHNALVVGHSNTIPELARLICECTIDDMDESEYDRLIVIAVVDGATMVRTLRQDRLFKP